MQVLKLTLKQALATPILTVVAMAAWPLHAGEPTLAELQAAASVSAGLVVHIGAVDGSLATALAKAQPVLILTVAKDTAGETRIRQTLVEGAVHGQVSASSIHDGQVAVIDNSAALVIADLDQVPGVSREEALRVARPFGTVWLRQGGVWSVIAKPRPEGADDWAQFHYDATMSDRSQDTLAGPARGLQWVAGPSVGATSTGVRIKGPVQVTVHQEAGLIARDAFSGLELWRAGKDQYTGDPGKYTLALDDERVYLWPVFWHVPAQAMQALDIRTGQTVIRYDQGINFVPPEKGYDGNLNGPQRQYLKRVSDSLQVRLTADGRLLQTAGPRMALLDARTGRRHWLRELPENMFHSHPIIDGERLYVIIGQSVDSKSYTQWPMTAIEQVLCIDLATGKEVWTYQGRPERELCAYNASIGAGRLVMSCRAGLKAGQMSFLVLNAATGAEEHYNTDGLPRQTPRRIDPVGAGHSGIRGNMIGDRLWVTSIGSIVGSFDLRDPVGSMEERMSRIGRPVGCTIYRFSAKYAFGSLTTYDLIDGSIQHTNAARTSCDLGAFPANGLSYITANGCFCHTYLPGINTFHSRPFAGLEQTQRLEAGPAKPTPAPVLTGTTTAWPSFLGNNQRAAWVDDNLPRNVRQIWQVRPVADIAAPPGLVRQWSDHWYAQGVLTQASVVGDLVVVAASHNQQVIAYDAANGKERWRTGVEGRIDSAPTIAGNHIVFGTRSGWVYALDAADGRLAWRFFAAPRRQMLVADGLLESPWPIHGTVVVEGTNVWVVAGRHSDADGGLFWWRLDLASGEPEASGRFSGDDLQQTTNLGGHMNNVVIFDRGYFMLPNLHKRVENGSLVDATWPENKERGERAEWLRRYEIGTLTHGRQGLLVKLETMFGYKLLNYGHTSGRLYAFKGDDFFAVGGSPFMVHRGGGDGSQLRAFRRLPKMETGEIPSEWDMNKREVRLHGSVAQWYEPNDRPRAGNNGLNALAVAGDAVLIAFTVNKNNHNELKRMPHRLRPHDRATGAYRQEEDLPLPAEPLIGGISSDDGRVFVVTVDGTLTAFGE